MKNGDEVTYECADIDNISFVLPETSNNFELECSDVTSTTAVLKVTPKDSSIKYYYDVATTAQYEQAGGAANIVNSYIQSVQTQYPSLTLSYILSAMLEQGYSEDEVTGLPADTDFTFYAIAVDDSGYCYGEPSVTTFHTLKGGDPADCTFDISYTGLYSEGLTVIVEPSDPSVRYWMGISSVYDYPGDYAMTTSVKAAIDEYVASNGVSLETVVKSVTFAGDMSEAESGLSSDTSYYIYVYAMDSNGNAAGQVYKKTFKTTSYDYSDADVSLSYRYFDGSELAEINPERFGNIAGKVLVQAVVTPNETAENYVWGLVSTDMTDADIYPEDACKSALLQGGFINVPTKNLIAAYTTATFLYYGADSYGVDGELRRLLAEFTYEGRSPASEYYDINTAEQQATSRSLKPSSVNAAEPFETSILRKRSLPSTFRNKL